MFILFSERVCVFVCSPVGFRFVVAFQTQSLYESNKKSNKMASLQESDVFSGVLRSSEVAMGFRATDDHFIHA